MQRVRSALVIAVAMVSLAGCAVIGWVKPEPTVTSIETGAPPSATPTPTRTAKPLTGPRLTLPDSYFAIALPKGATLLRSKDGAFSASATKAMEPLAKALKMPVRALAISTAGMQGQIVIGAASSWVVTVTPEATFQTQRIIKANAEALGMKLTAFKESTLGSQSSLRLSYSGPGNHFAGELVMVKPTFDGTYHIKVVGTSAAKVTAALDFIEKNFRERE